MFLKSSLPSPVTVKSLIMIPAAAFSLIPGLFMIFITDAFIIFMLVTPLFLDLISPVIRPVILSVVLYIRIGLARMKAVVGFPCAIRWRFAPVIIAGLIVMIFVIRVSGNGTLIAELLVFSVGMIMAI